jgi:hypothetical protein
VPGFAIPAATKNISNTSRPFAVRALLDELLKSYQLPFAFSPASCASRAGFGAAACSRFFLSGAAFGEMQDR